MASRSASETSGGTETRVDDPRPLGGRVAIGGDKVGDGAGPALVEDPQRHDLAAPARAGYADRVVAAGGRHAGHVGAVPVLVGRVALVFHPIPAARVVAEAVAIVIDPVRPTAGPALARVGPARAGQVGVVEKHAGVDQRDGRARVSRGHVPCLDGAHIGAGHPAGLAEVLEAPLEGEQGVGGSQGRTAVVVGLRVQHRVGALERPLGGRPGLAAPGLDQLETANGQAGGQVDPRAGAQRASVVGVGGTREAHDQLTRRRRRLRVRRCARPRAGHQQQPEDESRSAVRRRAQVSSPPPASGVAPTGGPPLGGAILSTSSFTPSKIDSARSRCSRSCVAITSVRSSAPPRCTAG